jgi:hypothetical protein
MSGHKEKTMHFAKLTDAYEKLAPIERGEPLLSAYYAESPGAYVSLMDELMPCQMGWFKPERQRPYMLCTEKRGYLDEKEMPNWHELFDHPVLLRKRGCKGMTTWENSALIGQPYRAPASDLPGVKWLKERGVTIFTRPDLSLWCPGQTHLVIAARGIHGNAIEDLGFKGLLRL